MESYEILDLEKNKNFQIKYTPNGRIIYVLIITFRDLLKTMPKGVYLLEFSINEENEIRIKKST